MGQLKSTLQCSVCKGASVTFDPFWDVCLPIPKKQHKVCSLSLSLSSVSNYTVFYRMSLHSQVAQRQ